MSEHFMPLSRFFGIILLLSIIPVFVLAGWIVSTEWQDYRRTEAALATLRVLRTVFVSAEKISVERGPTNAALGDDLPANPAIAARLAKARAASDLALANLAHAIATDPQDYDATAETVLNHIETALGAARHAVDATLALPRRARTAEMLGADVAGMIGVIGQFGPIMPMLSEETERDRPHLVNALLAVRDAAELREYAGQLGSKFTTALATAHPLTDADLLAMARIRGRMDELNYRLGLCTEGYADDTGLAAAMATMRTRYFGAGIAYVESVAALYRQRGDGGITPAAFAARYVPDMMPILGVRDALLLLMQRDLDAHHHDVRRMLIIGGIVGAITVTGFAVALIAIRRRVLRPLLQATEFVVDLADGRFPAYLPTADREDEIGDLLRAITILKRQAIERLRLESDREQLIDQLRVSSATDFMTGLLNRRDFYRTGEHIFAQARRYGTPLALIAIDIDRFKSINDRHGHATGDAVLIQVARILQEECRQEDVVCRFGGEEFMILAPHTEPHAAYILAERLRKNIATTPIALPEGGGMLDSTASFGVAGHRPDDANLDQIIRRADRALYAAKHAGRNRTEIDTSPTSEWTPDI